MNTQFVNNCSCDQMLIGHHGQNGSQVLECLLWGARLVIKVSSFLILFISQVSEEIHFVLVGLQVYCWLKIIFKVDRYLLMIWTCGDLVLSVGYLNCFFRKLSSSSFTSILSEAKSPTSFEQIIFLAEKVRHLSVPPKKTLHDALHRDRSSKSATWFRLFRCRLCL